jgi:hypothetical protein
MAAHPKAWDGALEALRYGSVCVNTPAVTGFAATPLVWGAYPGNTPQVGRRAGRAAGGARGRRRLAGVGLNFLIVPRPTSASSTPAL